MQEKDNPKINKEINNNNNKNNDHDQELKLKEKEIELKKLELEIIKHKAESNKFEMEKIKLQNNSQYSPKEQFDLLVREATILASMDSAPVYFKGKKADCFWIVQFAKRLNMDPVTIMNQIYFFHGKTAYSSAFMIAIINKCGKFSQLEFKYNGEGDNRTCIAQAYSKESNGQTLLKSVPVSLKMAKQEGWARKGTKWLHMTDLMLQYRAAALFCRAYASEFLNGHTKEEIEDINKINK